MAVVGTIEYIAKINTKDYESGAKKITDSNKDLEKGTEDASKKMQLSWRDSDKAFGSLVKGVIAGAAVAGAAVGAIAVSAIKSYASLEQSMGGAEAVFGEFGATVQDTARKSAAVMGTSANQYLETANKMGSLFQGAGFSVKESMELSGSAMQRATDVATAMGISTESALESIAGAAKGNFTMMDNLGVAMNDTTLQAYATSKGIAKTTQEMTNQEKVGLAMQLFMEKTSKYAGNYAKENDTLSGSMSTLSASWGNFLAGVEGSDKQLASAIGNVINVFGKQIPEVLGRMTGLVQNMVSSFLEANPAVATALEVFKQVATVIGIFLIPQLIRYIALQTMAGVQALIAGAKIAAGWLMALGPIGIISAAIAALAAVIIMNWTKISQWLEPFFSWVSGVAQSISGWFVSAFNTIQEAFGAAIGWMNAKWGEFSKWVEDNKQALINVGIVITTLLLPKLTQLGIAAIKAGASSVKAAITTSAAWVKSSVETAIAWAKTLPAIIAGFIRTAITSVTQSAIAAGAWITQAGLTTLAWAKTFLQFSIGMVTMVGQFLMQAARMAAGWLLAMGPIGLLIAAVVGLVALIVANWNTVKEWLLAFWEWLVSAASTAWDGIMNAFSAIGDWFRGIFEGVATIIKWYVGIYIGFFRGAWEGIKTIFGAVGGFFRGVWDTIAGIFGTIGSAIGNAIGNAFKFVVNSVINFAESTINGFIRAINGAIGLINKIPGVNISTLTELRIPRLAEGGIVPAQPGGILANIGEGREAEAVIPLSKLEAMIAGGGDTGGAPVTVNLSHSRGTMRQAAMDTIDLVNEVYRSRGMPEIGVTG